jgi:hypothetical protein
VIFASAEDAPDASINRTLIAAATARVVFADLFLDLIDDHANFGSRLFRDFTDNLFSQS